MTTYGQMSRELDHGEAAGDGTFLTQPESAARRLFGIAAAWREHAPGATERPAADHPSLGADRALPTAEESAQQRAGTDERETLGRIVHDVRLAENAKRERPFNLEPWDKRTGEQRELDRRIGVAVAAAERERIRRLAVEHHARIGESCDLHGTVHYRRDFAGLLGGEGEGRPRVAVDLNVRVRKHETYSGFEDVAGTDPASLRFGDRVLASEAEDRICSPAIVTGVDPERRLVYLVPDWHGWRDDPAAGGQPAPEEPPQGETP